jgi:hypothetical protein
MGYWLNNPKTARAAQEQFVRELANRVPDLKGSVSSTWAAAFQVLQHLLRAITAPRSTVSISKD